MASFRRRRNYDREGIVPRYPMEFENDQLLEEEELDKECDKLIDGRTETDKVSLMVRLVELHQIKDLLISYLFSKTFRNKIINLITILNCTHKKLLLATFSKSSSNLSIFCTLQTIFGQLINKK